MVELDELAGERMFWASLLKAEDETRNESLLNFYYI